MVDASIAARDKEEAMDGDVGTWWMVLSALIVILALPGGGKVSPRHARRAR
jgi:hypothetical protein